MKTLLVLISLLWLPVSAAAQSDDLLEKGKIEFREGRYDDARRTLERLAQEDASISEAHYLLARLYTETPLADRRKAERALDQALRAWSS